MSSPPPIHPPTSPSSPIPTATSTPSPPSRAVDFTTSEWRFSDPIDALSWLKHLGPARAALLETLIIRAEVLLEDWADFDKFLDGTPWFILFTALGQLATGVRNLDIYLCGGDGDIKNLPGWRGYGRCMLFVRGLAKMRGVERVALRGYYALPWPKWLKAQLGGVVVECSASPKLRAWQEGTERLVPREKTTMEDEEGTSQIYDVQKRAFERFERIVEKACEGLDMHFIAKICTIPMEVVGEEKRKEEKRKEMEECEEEEQDKEMSEEARGEEDAEVDMEGL